VRQCPEDGRNVITRGRAESMVEGSDENGFLLGKSPWPFIRKMVICELRVSRQQARRESQ